MTPAFCEDLIASPDVAIPIKRARRRWGSTLDALQARGVVQVVEPREYDMWLDNACGGCERELIREDGKWLAICQIGWCEHAEVDARRARVLGKALARTLAAACGLPPDAQQSGEIWTLGERRVGRSTVLFLWCPLPHRIESLHVDRIVDDRAPNAMVVLCPHQRVARPHRRRCGTRVVWLALDQVWTTPQRLDLAELWLRFRLGGPDLLWPRFDLVVDAHRLLWGGRWVTLSRNPQHRTLVDELLRAGDGFATRGDLLPVLFPDEFTNRGRMLSDPTKLDRRLRQLVSRVNAHVGAHPDGRALIGNLRARSDIEGGYRIEVDSDRRFILEENPHV